MDWKAEAIERLQGYAAQSTALAEIPEQIRQLEGTIDGLGAVDVGQIPATGGESGREEAIINNIDLREKLTWRLKNAQLWVQIVDGGLSVLDDEERLVLDRFFIHGQRGAAERLCEELSLELSQVYRRRNEALRLFTMALYGTV